MYVPDEKMTREKDEKMFPRMYNEIMFDSGNYVETVSPNGRLRNILSHYVKGIYDVEDPQHNKKYDEILKKNRDYQSFVPIANVVINLEERIATISGIPVDVDRALRLLIEHETFNPENPLNIKEVPFFKQEIIDMEKTMLEEIIDKGCESVTISKGMYDEDMDAASDSLSYRSEKGSNGQLTLNAGEIEHVTKILEDRGIDFYVADLKKGATEDTLKIVNSEVGTIIYNHNRVRIKDGEAERVKIVENNSGEDGKLVDLVLVPLNELSGKEEWGRKHHIVRERDYFINMPTGDGYSSEPL